MLEAAHMFLILLLPSTVHILPLKGFHCFVASVRRSRRYQPRGSRSNGKFSRATLCRCRGRVYSSCRQSTGRRCDPADGPEPERPLEKDGTSPRGPCGVGGMKLVHSGARSIDVWSRIAWSDITLPHSAPFLERVTI